MDTASLLNIFSSSIATIVTTYVVTRISLGKPVLAIHPAARTIAIRALFIAFCLAMVAWNGHTVLAFLAGSGPPTRSKVVFIPLAVFNVIAYFLMLVSGIICMVRKGPNNSYKPTPLRGAA